jgi:hypothetical protein
MMDSWKNGDNWKLFGKQVSLGNLCDTVLPKRLK